MIPSVRSFSQSVFVAQRSNQRVGSFLRSKRYFAGSGDDKTFKCKPIPKADHSSICTQSSQSTPSYVPEFLSRKEVIAFQKELDSANEAIDRMFKSEKSKDQKNELPDLIKKRLVLEGLVQDGEMALIQRDEIEMLKTLEKIDLLLLPLEPEERLQLQLGNAIKANMLVSFYKNYNFAGFERVTKRSNARLEQIEKEKELYKTELKFIGRNNVRKKR